MNGFTKQELRDLCDNARKKPCFGQMGDVYVFSMPGYQFYHTYNYNSREIYLVHVPTATARMIGTTKDTLTRTLFEMKARKTFLDNLFLKGGVTADYVDKAINKLKK